KCSSCGHNLEAEENMQKIFCKYCGTQNLITQDITHIHNTTHNTTHNTHHTQQIIHKTIIGKEQNEAEDHLRIANEFLSLGTTEKAKENFQKAIDLNPTDYRGWLGLGKVEVGSVTRWYKVEGMGSVTLWSKFDCERASNYFDTALKLAPEQEKESIKKKIREYKNSLVEGLLHNAFYYLNQSNGEGFGDRVVRGNICGVTSKEITSRGAFCDAIYYFKKAIEFADKNDISRIKFLASGHFHFQETLFNYDGGYNYPQVESLIEDLKAEIKAKIKAAEEAEKRRNSGHLVIDDDTELSTSAFEGRGFTAVTIPKSAGRIGWKAFKDCKNLTSVIFESGSKLTDIESRAFEGCTGLTSITIPDSVTMIEYSAFADWEKHQTIYANKKNSKKWHKKWKDYCKAKIIYRK
ncbi:MAG: leucine-rich repeat protein, partial [Firmicutes bacterium]|nr:leucine-rich repeat protein [Bacillota bacterium]